MIILAQGYPEKPIYKKGWFFYYSGPRPVNTFQIIRMMAKIRSTCIVLPAPKAKSPKSQPIIRMATINQINVLIIK